MCVGGGGGGDRMAAGDIYVILNNIKRYVLEVQTNHVTHSKG